MAEKLRCPLQHQFESWLLQLKSSFLLMKLAEQQRMAQVLGSTYKSYIQVLYRVYIGVLYRSLHRIPKKGLYRTPI